MQDEIDLTQRLDEFPASQHRPAPRPLDQYLLDIGYRDGAIAEAYASGGYALQEIGNHFGLHYSRVSKIIKKAKVKT